MEKISFDQMPGYLSLLIKKVEKIESLLQRENKVEFEQEQTFTLNTLKEYFKKKVSSDIPKGTIYNKVSQGIIPSRKFNGRLIFYKSEIDTWIESEFEKKPDSSPIAIQLPKK